MHLLYIHQYFAFPSIHSSTRSYDLASSFVKKGITVTIITTTTKVKGCDESRRWNYFEREGMRFWVLSSNYSQKLSSLKRIKAFLYFMWFASMKALQVKCDVVLATSTPITIALPALIKKWFGRTPFIFEVRDVWPEVPIEMGYVTNGPVIKFLYWFERFVYRQAAYVIPLSVGMEASIKRRCNITKLMVIPNISEINRFQRQNARFDFPEGVDLTNKKIILYAGAMGKVNGIMYVAELALEINRLDPDIVFVIIGVGGEKESIVSFCESKGILNRNIFIFEPVPKDRLPDLYGMAAIGSSFVIDNPVLWNNSANKFFDTLAAGKPVLINHEGWQADIIRMENMGYVLPARPSKADVERFVQYLNDKDLLAVQARNALNVGISKFSLDAAVDKYLTVLNRVQEQKK